MLSLRRRVADERGTRELLERDGISNIRIERYWAGNMTENSASLNILGICGSLRKGSYNLGLLSALQDIAPAGVTIDILTSWDDIPVLNADLLDEDGQPPVAVKRVADLIRAADAVIFASPEYCYSVPGPVKNLTDWLALPPHVNALRFKPTGVIGASVGPGGSARGQMVLRATLLFHDAIVMGKPEIAVAFSGVKFDPDGNLKDEATVELLQRYLSDFIEFSDSTRARRLDTLNREFIF